MITQTIQYSIHSWYEKVQIMEEADWITSKIIFGPDSVVVIHAKKKDTP